MITAWRLVKSWYAETAFTGESARRRGGRWNPIGTPVVYVSSVLSLATLETLVHLESEQIIDFVMIRCAFPEALVEQLDRSRLPDDWRGVPPPRLLQELGHEWASRRISAVLEVPSAVVPEENNYLLNPEHPDFASIDIGEARPFSLDLRLVT